MATGEVPVPCKSEEKGEMMVSKTAAIIDAVKKH